MRITKQLRIEAGHRLVNHESKCKNYHGHEYVFDIVCTADKLDDVGRVIDFSVIKSEVGGYLDTFLDHGMILRKDDPLAQAMNDQGCKVSVMAVNPTAENLAEHIFHIASGLLASFNVAVVLVRCHETPTCYAEYP